MCDLPNERSRSCRQSHSKDRCSGTHRISHCVDGLGRVPRVAKEVESRCGEGETATATSCVNDHAPSAPVQCSDERAETINIVVSPCADYVRVCACVRVCVFVCLCVCVRARGAAGVGALTCACACVCLK